MSIAKRKTTDKSASSKTKVKVAAKTNALARSKPIAYARFDARLSQDQKDLFEQAAAIKGFKSLTEFVIYYTSEAATIIIEKHNRVLASERDKNVFFDALVNSPKPNAALIKAVKNYNEQAASE